MKKFFIFVMIAPLYNDSKVKVMSINKQILVFAIILLSVNTKTTSAQMEDGFYHLRNVTTGRCLSINDTDPENYKVNWTAASVNTGGLRTYLSYDTVAVSPSCVIFIKRLENGQYDLCGQGSSLYAMSSGHGVDFSFQSNSTFTISVTARGITKRLSDGSPSDKDSWLMNRLSETEQWQAIPINTQDEYVGIRPDVRTADGTYYGTIYAGFNFRLVSPGMAAFYISDAEGAGFTLKEIEEEVIPTGTPVVIRCNSANPADNKIEPVIGAYTFDHTNRLDGVYFSLSVAKHRNVKLFDRITMRLLGLNEKGELAFIAKPPVDRFYKEQYLMANKAYLKVSETDADIMTLNGNGPDAIHRVVKEESPSDIYTLAGIRVSEDTPLRPGIYIQNGKKRMVR